VIDVTETATLPILIATTVTIAFLHTLVGVDHSLPFVVLGRARSWSLRKVMVITAVCGVGHVLSSVLLGSIGIALGIALDRLELFESTRGSLAAWLLIGLGGGLAARAAWRTFMGKPHSHSHVHVDGVVHYHSHDHHRAEHRHPAQAIQSDTTLGALFLVFVLGPCEPLIPLMMAPAVARSWELVALVAVSFGVVTLATMLAVVALGYLGLRSIYIARLEPHTELIAGLAIAASGVAIQVLGI
jgi:sulfite exporter TauE/SafE